MHNFGVDDDDNDIVDELKSKYQEIIVQQMVDESNTDDPDELRKIRIAGLKAITRATFLSNPIATEEDFKRLWPRILDDSLVEYTETTQYEIMEQLVESAEEEDDEDLDDDDEDDAEGEPPF